VEPSSTEQECHGDSLVVADGASGLLRDVFGPDKVSSRLVLALSSAAG
jgi:hypothetical protein